MSEKMVVNDKAYSMIILLKVSHIARFLKNKKGRGNNKVY